MEIFDFVENITHDYNALTPDELKSAIDNSFSRESELALNDERKEPMDNLGMLIDKLITRLSSQLRQLHSLLPAEHLADIAYYLQHLSFSNGPYAKVSIFRLHGIFQSLTQA